MDDIYEKLSKQRKKDQRLGYAPPFITTGGYQMWKEKLQYKNETMRGAIARIAKEAALRAALLDKRNRGFGLLYNRFFNLIWRGWLAPSTPVWANTGTSRGLPVSCSGSYIHDSIDGFYHSFHEAAMLTKTGHGCSCYLGDIRPRGTPYGDGEGSADGVLPVLQQMLATVSNVSQGSARRGATAFYIPLSHGDIWEVMDFHLSSPKRLQIGYIMDRAFVERLNNSDAECLAIYRRFLKVRCTTGKAYLIFPYKANAHAEELGIQFGSSIVASNLCTEIFLPSNEAETFSCILSSVNAYKYDEWKHDKEFISDCILFLNGITDSYLAESLHYEGMEKIRRFTERYRALGLGVLGFTSYLQKERIPLESFEAMHFNKEFFEDLYNQARTEGDLYDNATVLAVAPNVSSALVCGGVSQGIEPFTSNVFTQETAAGDVYRMNPELLAQMKCKGIDSEENIQAIKDNDGSIKDNPLFTKVEQEIFKTAYEIDQNWLIKLADDRGKWIDQGQSLNTFFSDQASEEYVSEVHRNAIKAPYVKSLYYLNTDVTLKGQDPSCFMCVT